MYPVFGDSDVVMSWRGMRTVPDKMNRSACRLSEIKGNLSRRSASPARLRLAAEVKVAGLPTQLAHTALCAGRSAWWTHGGKTLALFQSEGLVMLFKKAEFSSFQLNQQQHT